MTCLYDIFLWLKPLSLLEPSNNELLKPNAKIRKAFLELSGKASLEYSSRKRWMSLDRPSWRRTVKRGRELLHKEGHKWQTLGWGIGDAEERPNCLYLEGKGSKHTMSAVRFWAYSTCFAWKVKLNLLYSFFIGKRKPKQLVTLTFPTTSTGETCRSTCCSGTLGMVPRWGGQGQIYLRWKGYISIL